MSARLVDAVAVVSGGAGALGLAVARRFRAEGAIVYLVDRDHAALERASAQVDGAKGVVLELGDHDAAASEIARIGDAEGGIDVLVNCAARFEPCEVDAVSANEWQSILSLNLLAPFFLSRAALPYLRASRLASIINVSSVAAYYARADQLTYCTSKAALEHMTRVLALAFAADRVRVNTLRPGLVDAGMGAGSRPEAAAAIPLGRAATVDDIAEGAIYLAGAVHVTGQVLCIDGGQTINFVKINA